MAYKCLECGNIFEEGEQATWSEYQGECHGVKAFEDFSGCPACKGEYEETKQCSICGGEFLEDELHFHCEKGVSYYVCNDCIDECRDNFDLCYKIAENDEKKAIQINPLIASLLDNTDIEVVLYQYVKNNKKDVDCTPYIEQDKDWFATQLVKEVKK